MECNKEKAIKAKGVANEMMENNRKRESTKSSENWAVSDHVPGQNLQCLNKENRLRSMRRRHRINYRDNLSDDDEEDFSKRFKEVGYPSPTKESEMQHLSCATTPNGERKKIEHCLSNIESFQNTEMEIETSNESVHDIGLCTVTESKSLEYPDPDFSNFYKDKDESCFKVGQVWAVYDTFDGMPRFYGVIRDILSPEFKLRITWLEPEPLNETKWLYEGFLTSCGRFRIGNLEHIEDHLMFSHLVCVTNGNNNDSINIFPLKGETWALLKDWGSKNLNYEFVEVLSNYDETIGVHVAYMDKTKGFTCLFHRVGDPFLVPTKGMFRFSHRIPSMKMTGMERDDVPEGSFELDPTSLPIDQLDVSASSINKSVIANFMEFVNSAENWVPPIPNQVLEPEVYKFAAERSQEKFQIGQCWALYSDEDALPRYYGLIKKIDTLPQFVLHVAWFYACPLPKSTIQWHDKTMPIGCGLFKFLNSKLNKYIVTNKFSHVVVAEPLKKGLYKIFPKTGEVWAVYKNWSPQLMKGNTLEYFEYEIVEIVDVSDNYVDVKFLEWVNGFKSVYKARVEEEEADKVVKICVSEHLRFSHRIPAFCLTEERDGSLRGFWELDPAGMPLCLRCIN
ncbi:uncharacterized protein [Solanum lycopersicum]|uniref:DUF3444 domain-containing protein n=1 Tax=Solanum lycopersicum TaxID=4081 RepID=A0A3Q7EET9_SOLLC|nr:uncharacterized protein LOC112940676 [Solanum lycopersicum]